MEGMEQTIGIGVGFVRIVPAVEEVVTGIHLDEVIRGECRG